MGIGHHQTQNHDQCAKNPIGGPRPLFIESRKSHPTFGKIGKNEYPQFQDEPEEGHKNSQKYLARDGFHQPFSHNSKGAVIIEIYCFPKEDDQGNSRNTKFR